MLLNSTLLFFSLFLCVFNIKTNFPPYYTNVILAGLGCVYLFSCFYLGNIKLNKNIFYFIILVLFLPITFFISLIFNLGSSDFYYLKTFFLNNIVYLLSTFFIYMLFFNEKRRVYDDYVKFLAMVVSLQLILSLVGFLNAGFFDFIFNIIAMERDSDTLGGMSEYRLVGVGASFFGSGVINCITLLLIANSIMNNSNKNNLTLIISFFIIAFIGVLSSRTTIVGLIFSFIIFFLNFRRNKKFVGTLFTILLVLIMAYPVINTYSERFSTLLDFGLGFLLDFENSEGSKSLAVLQEYFEIIPNNYKTWLIGDAKFGDQMSYYKGTDVGIYRIVFCTGIIGLIFYFLLQFYLLFKIKDKYLQKTSKLLIAIVLIILNLKGVASFFVVLLIPYFLSVVNKYGYNGGYK